MFCFLCGVQTNNILIKILIMILVILIMLIIYNTDNIDLT